KKERKKKTRVKRRKEKKKRKIEKRERHRATRREGERCRREEEKRERSRRQEERVLCTPYLHFISSSPRLDEDDCGVGLVREEVSGARERTAGRKRKEESQWGREFGTLCPHSIFPSPGRNEGSSGSVKQLKQRK
ncbi:hypothetical protein CFOL_v3_03443, partial [Cephalotus follicularis]